MSVLEPNTITEARKIALKIVNSIEYQPNLDRPAEWHLKDMAAPVALSTKHGSLAFFSNIRSRSAAMTLYVGHKRVQQKNLNAGQKKIAVNLIGTLTKLGEYLQKAPLIKFSRTIGNNTEFTPKCTLYFSLHSKDNIRIPYMWAKSLFPEVEETSPHLRLVYVPEWPLQDRQILVFPEIGITFVLGSDYFGEAKKGFLRMAMWFAKLQGMLGLHTGTKIIKAKDIHSGEIKTYSMVIFGLSGTGKTTHTCHNHFLDKEGEGVWICQDDFPIIKPDGSFFGTERGFFIKTDSLAPESQPLLWEAALKPHAVFENVMVDYKGNLLFDDETLSANGRGIIRWEDMGKYRAPTVNTPAGSEVDGIIFAINTRRHDVVPICSKLNLEQLAAFFALGESVITAAADPTKVGESVRTVGTDPFIIGDEGEHINRFYEILKSIGEDKVHGYLLNTGGAGELFEGEGENRKKVQNVNRVEIVEMATIIKNIARNNIKWKKNPHFGTLEPEKVEGVDMDRFSLDKYYDEATIKRLVTKLKKERIEYLEKFGNIYPEILNALKC